MRRPPLAHAGRMWLAILVTVVASTACSIGKALQKEGTRHLPRISLERKILKQYLQSRVWLAGLVADVGGGALQVTAFALAPVRLLSVPRGGRWTAGSCPGSSREAGVGCAVAQPVQEGARPHMSVSVKTAAQAASRRPGRPPLPGPAPQVSIVQPISGVGLVGLALYSHFFLRERLQLAEWAAVALAAGGTLGLGATSASEDDSSSISGGDEDSSGGPGALRMVGVVAALALLNAAVLLVRQQRARQRPRRAGGDRSSAAMYGLQAGACFGLSAASCRTGGLVGRVGFYEQGSVRSASHRQCEEGAHRLQSCGLALPNTTALLGAVKFSFLASEAALRETDSNCILCLRPSAPFCRLPAGAPAPALAAPGPGGQHRTVGVGLCAAGALPLQCPAFACLRCLSACLRKPSSPTK